MRKDFLAMILITGLMFAAWPAAAQTGAAAANASDGLSRVLVAYYSFTGNTAKVAEALAAHLGADIYRIETREPYEENPRPQVKMQREQNQWPAIEGPLPDMGAYDVLVIGMPVWGGDAPPPVVSFLQQTNLSRLRIMYFCTDAGRPREFMEKFKGHVKTGEIVSGMNFTDLYQDNAQLNAKINAWLAEILTRLKP